ncbi:MAG: glycerate kinase [Anaerolineae bacterium]|nr:glycerate kinase [Anaerolineae bacterium]
MRLIRAALAAVDPARAVHNAVRRAGDTLHVGTRRYDLGAYERVYVVGAGKAGAPMAQALSEVLGDALHAGWVNVKHGHVTNAALPPAIAIHEAGHPIPDEAGRAGAVEVLRLATQATARDLVFCLISGGGSALLPLPVDGIALADLQAMTDALLRCGATIIEINAVRKHCSQIKGGQLARAAHPATVVALLLSDVVGNPLDAIASGPTVPDPTTYAQAQAVIDKYGIGDQVPPAIRRHLAAGVRGDVPETPKEGDPAFERVQVAVIGSNAIAAQAARSEAEAMGYHTALLSTYVEGEAREVARVFAAIAKSLRAEGWPLPRPACAIAGGETTVTVTGAGKGGRNQELALAAALALDGWHGTTVVTLATDGNDGPTDAAGAIVDGTTVARARELGLPAADHLARNDAYPFFDRLGDLIRTGPTNTNVNDLTFILVP